MTQVNICFGKTGEKKNSLDETDIDYKLYIYNNHELVIHMLLVIRSKINHAKNIYISLALNRVILLASNLARFHQENFR